MALLSPTRALHTSHAHSMGDLADTLARMLFTASLASTILATHLSINALVGGTPVARPVVLLGVSVAASAVTANYLDTKRV